MLHDKNTQKTKRSILKYFLLGCGTLVALVLAFAIWVGVSLFSGPDAMEKSEFHPFRSPEAKEKYLQRYDELALMWPVASETKMVETDFGHTFVRISGPAEARPLLLLPGGGASSLMWAYNIEGLSKEFRTYAVDNIYDVGRSIYTRPFKNGKDFAEWLDGLFDALDLTEKINIAGISYGGWITSQYALHYPERVQKIVLLAPAGTVLPFEPEFLKRAIVGILPHRYFLKNTIEWIFEDLAKQGEASRELIDTFVDDAFLARQSFKFKIMVNPAVLSDGEWQRIKMPVLFLVGENEKIYSAEEAVRRLQNITPHVQTEILPNCGHDLFIVQKDVVDEKIVAFLQAEGGD